MNLKPWTRDLETDIQTMLYIIINVSLNVYGTHSFNLTFTAFTKAGLKWMRRIWLIKYSFCFINKADTYFCLECWQNVVIQIIWTIKGTRRGQTFWRQFVEFVKGIKIGGVRNVRALYAIKLHCYRIQNINFDSFWHRQSLFRYKVFLSGQQSGVFSLS